MDEKYINNLGSSPHIDEGIWNQLKAKSAAFTQGAKNLAAQNKLTGWMNPNVASTESSKFQSVLKSFIQRALNIIKNFDAQTYPWISQHPNQITQFHKDSIQQFQELENALNAVNLKEIPVMEGPQTFFPTYGTIGASASGGLDNIINANKKMMDSAYRNFLNDLKTLNFSDQYLNDKIFSSKTGVKEVFEILGKILNKDLINHSISNPTASKSSATVTTPVPSTPVPSTPVPSTPVPSTPVSIPTSPTSKAAHSAAVKLSSKPVEPSVTPPIPPSGKDVVAPVQKTNNPAIVPSDDPDAPKPMEIPPELKRSAKNILEPDSPAMVDYDLTQKGLEVLSDLLVDPKRGLISAIEHEIKNRNALKAEYTIDANANPIVHNYKNGSIAYLVMRYIYDKNTNKHVFEGHTVTYSQQKTQNESESKTFSRQTKWHPIFAFNIEDVSDIHGKLLPNFDIYTLIKRTNPELWASMETVIKVIGVDANYQTMNKKIAKGLHDLELSLSPENIRGYQHADVSPKKVEKKQKIKQQQANVEQPPKDREQQQNVSPDQHGQIAKSPLPQKRKPKSQINETFNFKDFFIL